METILDRLKIRRTWHRASLQELKNDLTIISGTATRRLLDAEIESLRERIARLSDQIEKREIK